MGWDSLLVLTGVTGLEELVRRDEGPQADVRRPRPRWLGGASTAAEVDADGVESGGWTATVDDGRAASLEGDGSVDDWWRVVAVAAWRHLDETGQPVATDGVRPPE